MRRPLRAGIAALVLGLAGPVAAQERPLSPEALMDRLEGRTVAFINAGNGATVGWERFVDRVRTRWRRSSGICAHGVVTLDATTICFRYDDDPEVAHCWTPFEDPTLGEIGYTSVLTGERQFIREAPPGSADCRDELLF